MSGRAWIAAVAWLTSAPEEPIALEVAARRVAVGEVVEVAILGAASERELRFAEPPRFDAALALLERRLVEPHGEGRAAGMKLRFLACAPGTIAIGPFALLARDRDGSVRARATTAAVVEVDAPWPGPEPPPFEAWRRPAPSAAGGGWKALLGIAVAAAAAAWIGRAGRSRAPPPPRPPPRPSLAEFRELLRGRVAEEVEARRSWCVAVQERVRAELASRSRAAAFAWTREELVAGAGLGAWSGAEGASWAAVLAALEEGIFAPASVRDPRSRIAQPLLVLLGERSA